MSPLLLQYPIAESICNNLSFKDILNFMLLSKPVYSTIHSILLKDDVDNCLLQYIPNPVGFRRILHDTGSIVCGKIIDDYRSIPNASTENSICIIMGFTPMRSKHIKDTREMKRLYEVLLNKFFERLCSSGSIDTSLGECTRYFGTETRQFNGLSIQMMHWNWRFPEILYEKSDFGVLTSLGTYSVYGKRNYIIRYPVNPPPHINWPNEEGYRKVTIRTIKSTFKPAVESRSKFTNTVRRFREHMTISCIAGRFVV